MIITISGLAGSGKTTITKLLSKKLGWSWVSAGILFRELAKQLNYSLESFIEIANKNPEIDRKLDAEMIKHAKDGNKIIEGRLVGIFAHKNNMESLRVWLKCNDEIRAERIARRDNISFDEAMRKNREREKHDYYRYLRIYGIDINELSCYSLIIDTTYRKPEEIVRIILDKLGEYHVRYNKSK